MKLKRKILAVFLAVCLLGTVSALGVTALAADADEVVIPDATLKAQIIDTLELSSSTVTEADMRQITVLETPNNDPASMITDLTGLEYATNLRELNLDYNKITDLTPLQGLTSLESLNISYNNGATTGTSGITDISCLSGLTNLKSFSSIGNENVTDYSVVSNFKQLTYLNLSICKLDDVSFLSGLTSLESLYLPFNAVYDVTPLAGLTSLKVLALGNNLLQDISVVRNMTALTQLTVENNYIEDFSPVLSLSAIERLDLSRNFLSDEQMASIMEAFPEATIYVSPVLDDDKKSELICLNAYEQTLNPGGTFSLAATDFAGTALEGVTWSTSNADVATVDANGNVTAVGTGFCYIGATYNGYTRNCSVTVTTPETPGGNTDTPAEGGGLTGGEIGAIVAVCVVAVAAAVLIAVLLKKNKKGGKGTDETSEKNGDDKN